MTPSSGLISKTLNSPFEELREILPTEPKEIKRMIPYPTENVNEERTIYIYTANRNSGLENILTKMKI